ARLLGSPLNGTTFGRRALRQAGRADAFTRSCDDRSERLAPRRAAPSHPRPERPGGPAVGKVEEAPRMSSAGHARPPEDARAEVRPLFANLKAALPALEALLAQCSEHWHDEDPGRS